MTLGFDLILVIEGISDLVMPQSGCTIWPGNQMGTVFLVDYVYESSGAVGVILFRELMKRRLSVLWLNTFFVSFGDFVGFLRETIILFLDRERDGGQGGRLDSLSFGSTVANWTLYRSKDVIFSPIRFPIRFISLRYTQPELGGGRRWRFIFTVTVHSAFESGQRRCGHITRHFVCFSRHSRVDVIVA